MWNIRMRASKAIGNQQSAVSDKKIIHISGAEGIYKEKDMLQICNEYLQRAVNHPRGKPDEIVITIEKIKQKTRTIPLLSVKTLKCKSSDEAKEIIIQKLASLGISKKAVNSGFKVLKAQKAMRGASLMLAESGTRVEPDKNRGVRVSKMGIGKTAGRMLAQKLSKMGINTATVKEALILASKVASCPDIIAEACVSDDPDYTTGYFASEKEGYLRLVNIKKPGEMHGGRVFFIKENADIAGVIQYLERIPVIIRRV